MSSDTILLMRDNFFIIIPKEISRKLRESRNIILRDPSVHKSMRGMTLMMEFIIIDLPT